MYIRTGFYLLLSIGAALIVSLILALAYSQAVTNAAITRNQALDQAFLEGMQSVQLTNEVLLYGEDRAIRQWQSQIEEAERAVGGAGASVEADSLQLIEQVRRNLQDMRPLFGGLVNNPNAPLRTERATASNLLSSQMFQKAAVLQSSLRNMKLASDRELESVYGAARNRQFLIFSLFAGATFLFGGGVSLIFGNVILRRIRQMEHTIRLINAGESHHRMPLPSFDEIGFVEKAFNKLLDQQERDRRELQITADRFRATFEQAAVGICHVSIDGRWLRVNQRLCDIVGCCSEHLLGGTLQELTHPDDVDLDAELRRELLDGLRDTYSVEKRVLNLRGDAVWTNLTASLVTDDQGAPDYFILVFEDISSRKAAEQEIAFLAFHDVLTRLPNRVLVRDRFIQAAALIERAGGKMALLFLDLDGFKTINDTLGHPVGDALLIAVAERLKRCVREVDTISRQGGDEFLIHLVGIDDAAAISRVTDNLLEQLSLPFSVDGHELATSTSIGISIYPDDGSDFDSLLQMADVAMYQAKAAGRNTCRFFTEQMNLDASDRLILRNGLRRALEQNEFVLYYQPQVNLTSGAVIGMEALIRWQHPDLGMVPPGRFIPVAEDSGLIVPMGEWVIREACRQMVQFRAAGWQTLTISVNLSAVQFRRSGLEQTVQQALQDYPIPASSLELELTESMLIHDAEGVLQTLQRLKELGVKLSIDDFGTGYSSLAYLKRFNVDRLKIDQSFVRDLTSNGEDAAIVRAIVQLAKSLDLVTIAEGVEEPAQYEALRSYLCDEVQGYLIAKPMPAAELLAFLARNPT